MKSIKWSSCAVVLLALVISAGTLTGCGKGSSPEANADQGSDKPMNVIGDDGKGTKLEASEDSKDIKVTNPDGSTVKIESQGDGTTYTDSKNGTSATIGAMISEEELGVPFYPGSKEDQKGSMKSSSPEGNAYICVRTSTDSVEKIAAFYEKELQKPTVTKANNTINVVGKSADGVEVTVGAIRGPDGKTNQITIVLNRK